MAITVTATYDRDIYTAANLPLQVMTGNLSLAGTYETGGFSFDPETKIGDLAFFTCDNDGGYRFVYDKTNKKVLAYTGGAQTSGAGSSHTHANTISASGAVTGAPSATENLFIPWAVSDLKGSANTDSENVDTGTEPTNANLISTYATQTVVRAAAGVLAIAAQPDVARNIGIVIQNDSGGSLNLYEGVTTFTVVGTFGGTAQTETITFTSTAGNKAVADAGANQFRIKYGVKPYDTITSITEGVVGEDMAGDLKIGVCPGSKLGIYNVLATPAEADVVKASKDAANLAVSGIVNTTNYTINFGALADGADVMYVAKCKGYGISTHTHTAGAITMGGSVTAEAAHTHAIAVDVGDEVAAGVSLAALTGIAFLAVGYLA